MIQEDKLIEQLESLKRIGPSDNFARKLRGVILSTPRPQRHVWNISNFRLPAKESFGFALSIGFVAVLVVLVLNFTSQVATNPIVATNTTKTASVSMLNEANAAVDDINIHLAEVSTFDAATEQTSNALSSINPSSISREGNSINSSATTSGDDASKIDTILNQLSN